MFARYLGIIFIFLATFIVNLSAKDTYGKNINYKIETERFVILYNENMSQLAEKLASNIEVWAQQVLDYHGATSPRVKIYVTLGNFTDILNAYSYSNSIMLYFNSDTIYNMHTNWLETTFKHELTHNINLLYDKPPYLTYTLGLFEILIYPRWVEEGLATYNETNLESSFGLNNGRGENEEFLSKIRYLYNDEKQNYFFYEGASPYDSGLAFFKFYGSKYGQEVHKNALKEYLSSYSIKIIHSPVTVYARNVNLTADELYEEYDLYLEKEYGIASRDYIEGDLLIKDKISDENAVFSILEVNDNKLFYSGLRKNLINGTYDRAIYQYDIKTGKVDSYLILNTGFSTISKSGDEVFYTNIENINYSGVKYTKAYHYNAKSTVAKTKKLDLERVKVIEKVGENFYYVAKNQNKEALVSGKDNVVVIGYQHNLIFSNMKYDERSNSIFFEAGEIGELGTYIYKYDVAKKTLIKLVKGKSPYIDGNDLYFSSYVEGQRYNIYKLNLIDNQVLQLTDTKYGAFNPAYYRGMLYYTTYNNINYNGLFGLLPANFLNKEENSFLVNKPIILEEKAYLLEEANVILADGVNNEYIVQKNSSSDLVIGGGKTEGELSLNEGKKTYQSVPYEGSVLSFIDYKLDGVIIDGGVSASFASLANNHIIDIGFGEVDYSLYKKNAEQNLASWIVNFSYNPNQLGKLALEDDVFTLRAVRSFDGENHAIVAKFKPIIYSGYGNLPFVVGDFQLDHNGDYMVGGRLSFVNLNKLVLSSGYTSYYDRTQYSSYYSVGIYSMASVKFYNGIGSTDYIIDVGEMASSNPTKWRIDGADYVVEAKIKRDFVFDVYKGARDGRLGVKTAVIVPYFTYLYGDLVLPDQYGVNTYKTTYVGVDLYLKAVIQYNITFKCGVGVNRRDNYGNYANRFSEADYKVYSKCVFLEAAD